MMTPRILYIEDEPLNRRLVQMILARIDYRYLEAANGEEGILLAETERPDLILVDIGLPDMDGYAVLEELRNNVMTAHIPVVALTAHIMNGDRADIMAAGFDGYLAKPVNKIIVRNMIERILHGSLHSTIAG